MKVLIYGTEMVAGRISPLLKEMGIETVAISGDMTGANLNYLLTNLTDIGLAILDTNEECINRLCPFLSRLGYIPIALLVNGDSADWEWLCDCDASAYISLEAGKEEFASRLLSVTRRYLPESILEKV
jgi:hypothetical protein